MSSLSNLHGIFTRTPGLPLGVSQSDLDGRDDPSDYASVQQLWDSLDESYRQLIAEKFVDTLMEVMSDGQASRLPYYWETFLNDEFNKMRRCGMFEGVSIPPRRPIKQREQGTV